LPSLIQVIEIGPQPSPVNLVVGKPAVNSR